VNVTQDLTEDISLRDVNQEIIRLQGKHVVTFVLLGELLSKCYRGGHILLRSGASIGDEPRAYWCQLYLPGMGPRGDLEDILAEESGVTLDEAARRVCLAMLWLHQEKE
jgi:hypothetical protein